MSLSATLFYTDKIYPMDVITGKSSIPDDPNERLKDKVFMSVVFTVKHYCEYNQFVLPETRFKEELKCTEDEMTKILDSLGRKYNMVFRKKTFKTVGELTIYVKDHKENTNKDTLK